VTGDKKSFFVLSLGHPLTCHWRNKLLAIRLMRMGAKKRPSYRIVVKEKLSKRDGAYIESIGTYNPIGKDGEIRLDAARAQYWIERGAQPTDTVRRLVKANAKAQAAQQTETTV
jgi:small subunit ribosomal protein S16